MRSPRKAQASSATKKGAVKLIAAALASGMLLTPMKNIAVEVMRQIEPRICRAGRRVRKADTPWLGSSHSSATSRCEAVRAQMICSDG